MMLRSYVKIACVILTINIICVTSETGSRCGRNPAEGSGCFEERIEKSRHKIKHTIQLKSLAAQPVSMIYFILY